MVHSEPTREDTPSKRFEAVPANIEVEHRIAAREVEAILRRAFSFGETHRERLEQASLAIAHRMIVNLHQAYELIHDRTEGTA